MAAPDQTSLSLRYQPGAASIDDLQAEISSALGELADPDSELARVASGLGVASAEFVQAEGTVDQEGKGFGDVLILIAIFAPAANHALRNMWDELIWPRIKSQLGADALGDEAAQDDSDRGDSDQGTEELCPGWPTSGVAKKLGSVACSFAQI